MSEIQLGKTSVLKAVVAPDNATDKNLEEVYKKELEKAVVEASSANEAKTRFLFSKTSSEQEATVIFERYAEDFAGKHVLLVEDIYDLVLMDVQMPNMKQRKL